MKRFLLVVSALLLFSVGMIAQNEVGGEASGIVLDLGTFTGIMAVVSMLVTQVIKAIPAIDSKTIYKILTSVLVGVIVCTVGWFLKIAPPLLDLTILQVLLYGLAVGLSGCGFYDVVRAIGALFKK